MFSVATVWRYLQTNDRKCKYIWSSVEVASFVVVELIKFSSHFSINSDKSQIYSIFDKTNGRVEN